MVAMALVERGDLELGTTARSVLGADLPLVDGRVTVQQLLAPARNRRCRRPRRRGPRPRPGWSAPTSEGAWPILRQLDEVLSS